METARKWFFTVDVDGYYYPDVYEGHSHPFPDPDLIACAKFCAVDGKIETIVESLGEWEFFTDDKKLQKEIELEPNSTFTDATQKEYDGFYPISSCISRNLYGMNCYVYGAIHIWRKGD